MLEMVQPTGCAASQCSPEEAILQLVPGRPGMQFTQADVDAAASAAGRGGGKCVRSSRGGSCAGDGQCHRRHQGSTAGGLGDIRAPAARGRGAGRP